MNPLVNYYISKHMHTSPLNLYDLNKEAAAKAMAFVLRVPMHCSCDGCVDKICTSVKDLTLRHG
jgi:hypothetical protein